MASNLRSKRMQGYATDSAGNVLRNADIVVKEDTPSGINTVATVVSDDDGSFLTPPLPTGTYDIYESGIRVARHIHCADQNSIQCFKADPLNYPNDFPEFSLLADFADDTTLNDYKYVLQIEPDILDISVYGNTFPIINRTLTASFDPFDKMYDFYTLTSDSRITTTRFDVEYYAPLTSTDQTYRRVRWAGVPAIRFYAESKLVIPLDYYSIMATLPKGIYDVTGLTVSFPTITSGDTLSINSSIAGFDALELELAIGDIVKFITDVGLVWYGIYHQRSGTARIFAPWRSSNFVLTAFGSSNVVQAEHFDAMFNTMENISELANERFTVVENIYAQNQTTELYQYTNYNA